MRNLLLYLLILFVGLVPRLWAAGAYSAQTSTQEGDAWESGAGEDADMDSGADDDKADASTEKSRFERDEDDTYIDNSTDLNSQPQSKFKEEKDEDDLDSDKSDQTGDGSGSTD